VSGVWSIVYLLLWLYVLVLLARVVIDLVMMISRDWTPRGPVLLLVEAVFSLTDPPLRFLRRFIPPLRLGGIMLDLSFLVLFILVQILLAVVRPLT
jgi:YggT family protein